MVEGANKKQGFGVIALKRHAPQSRHLWITVLVSILQCYRFSASIVSVSLMLAFLIAQRCDAQSSAVEQQPKENYLELYVNSKDQKHFATVIDLAVRLQQKNTIPIAAIYHIGDLNSVTPEIRAKLWSSKLKLFALSGVPSDVPIITSPAWVFVTLNGRRIVEGTLAIESFVDEQGAFRDGSRIPDPAAALQATPLQKMEGF